MSTYTANVPITGQSLGNSRPTINNNFQAIQTVYDENHVDFNASNAGAHTHVDMLAQGANPDPATGLISHFSKDVSGVTEWFMQRENTGVVFQMSKGNPLLSSVGNHTEGNTFLPGGFIMKFGFVGPLGGPISFITVNYLTPFPNAIFSAIASPTDVSLYGTISSLVGFSNSGFRYQFPGTTTIVPGFYLYYTVIGN